MVIRAMEMHVSVPKSHNIGKMQDAAQQRPVNEQVLGQTAQKKILENQKNRTQETDKSEQNKIKEEEKEKRKRQQQEQEQEQEQQMAQEKTNYNKEKKTERHPFKGHKLDISL